MSELESERDMQIARREIDKQLIGVLQSYQIAATDMSEMKMEIQKLEGKIEMMLQTLTPLVQKHEKSIYGEQERMGEGGIISGMAEIKSDIRNSKFIFGSLGVVIAAAISAFFNRILGR